MNTNFVPQTEPLWIGLRYCFDAVSGRVIGWTTERVPADYKVDPKPGSITLPGPCTRGRAVVLVHASTDPDTLGLAPIITVDANWPARYVTTAEEAWGVALHLAQSYNREVAASEDAFAPPEQDRAGS